ncbi:M23 family metallopeptidase [Lacrimispora brassicae]
MAERRKARKAVKQAGKTYNTVAMGNINRIRFCPLSGRNDSDASQFPFPGIASTPTYSYSAGIFHDSSCRRCFCRLYALLPAFGMRLEVWQGQVIANVGYTVYSTVPYLHFEIRKDGSQENR